MTVKNAMLKCVCCVTQYALGSHCHMQRSALPAELPHTVAGRSRSEHCWHCASGLTLIPSNDKSGCMAQSTGNPRKEFGWCQEPDTGGKTGVRFLAGQATFVVAITLRPQWVLGGLFVGRSAELTAEQSAPESPSPRFEDHATCLPQPD